jgi:hypothetical protein
MHPQIIRMRCALLSLILLQMLLATATASVRIAVISDADNQDLSALVTSELSTNPSVSLVERDDLAKIGDELKLQQLAGTDSVALGKLIGAQGLIFISKGPSGLQVRFTAVGLGYALFDDQIADGFDTAREAKSIAHLVEGYAPKLQLSPSQVLPISVLNLRTDYATVDSTALERKLTLLFESGLASQSDYIVLERRHAWSLGFERALDPASKALLQGAYLIDGTLGLPAKDTGDFTVHLRLRSPSGKESDTDVQGSTSNLPALVKKMIGEIKSATGSTGTSLAGQTESEAQTYLKEGYWGWQHHADDAALEALDSAELLGANIAEVEAIRTLVLGNLINKGMENWYPKVLGSPPSLDANELSRRADLAFRVIPEIVLYRDGKMDTHLKTLSELDSNAAWDFRSYEIEEVVTYSLSKLLVLLEQAKSQRADELRQNLRKITNYDPVHGQMGLELSTRMNAGFMGNVFADDWAQNLDEEPQATVTVAGRSQSVARGVKSTRERSRAAIAGMDLEANARYEGDVGISASFRSRDI